MEIKRRREGEKIEEKEKNEETRLSENEKEFLVFFDRKNSFVNIIVSTVHIIVKLPMQCFFWKVISDIHACSCYLSASEIYLIIVVLISIIKIRC